MAALLDETFVVIDDVFVVMDCNTAVELTDIGAPVKTVKEQHWLIKACLFKTHCLLKIGHLVSTYLD